MSSVVLFHAGAQNWLPGGFTGVDVFYVISGFLIVGGMGRELLSTGRFDILAFASRRVMRILPMLLITILLIAAAAWWLMNPLQAFNTYRSLQAAALHYANFYYAAQPMGYFADDQVAPALHLWSISTEEQFYVGVMVVGLLIGVLLRRSRTLTPWYVLIGTATAVSFLLSVALSDASGSVYYLPSVRVWEIGVGALLGLWAARDEAVPKPARISLRLIGLVLIGWGLVAITPADPFPSWRALFPVVGTALLLLAGSNVGPRREPGYLAAPVKLGDASYSLYLLHWPAFVFVPIALGRPLGVVEIAALTAACVAASIATYHLLEKPLMSHPVRKKQPGLVVAYGIAAFIAVAALVSLLIFGNPLSKNSDDDPSGGAQPATGQIVAPEGAVPTNLDPSLVDAGSAPVFDGDCLGVMTILDKPSCWYGDIDAAQDIVLYGDSHAGHFMPALDAIAKERGYRVLPMVLNACPSLDIPVTKLPEGAANPYCGKWQEKVAEDLKQIKPAMVVVSNDTALYEDLTATKTDPLAQASQGYAGLLERLPAETKLVVLSDTQTWPSNPVECLSSNLDDASACQIPLPEPSSMYSAQSITGYVGARGTVIDTSTLICADACYATNGNLLIYQDTDHLTQVFVGSLTSRLEPLLFDES